MKPIPVCPLICCALLTLTAPLPAAEQNVFMSAEVDGVKAFLQDNFPPARSNACMVIGLIDEQGSRAFGGGTLGDGADIRADGETLFFIGSVSKTFTALLLQNLVEHGEVKLDDPVAKFLPASVHVPSRNGREITLLDLATHTGGFPMNPDNMSGATAKEQYETYTVQKLYQFLSHYPLPRNPGTEFQYSNVGMALLGHVLALKAQTNFESLVVNRICRPLGMQSTCINPPPELKARLAMAHDDAGRPSPPWKFQAYSPAGDIHSTANDLLKFVAAEAGLTASPLTSSMAKTQEIRCRDSRGLPDVPGFGTFGRTAMDWVDRDAFQPPGMDLLGHAGGAGDYHAWIGFDKRQRRGVVVLSTAGTFSVEAIGWTILQRLPLNRDSSRMIARETVGLGFAFDRNAESQTLRITKVFTNSPAAKAGLTVGLVLESIDDVPTAGKTVAECLALLRTSHPGVRLRLIDQSRNETNTVEVTKGKFLIAG